MRAEDLRVLAKKYNTPLVSISATALQEAVAATLPTQSSQSQSGDYQPLSAVLTATTASFTAALKSKLDDIEAEATADQSATEIVAALDALLGGTSWRESASASAVSAVVTVASNAIEHTEVVALAGCTDTSKVLVSLGHHADTDENTAEMLSIESLSASPGTDQATVTMSFREPTSGQINLLLMVA